MYDDRQAGEAHDRKHLGLNIKNLRISIRFLILLIPVLAIVVISFNSIMERLEKQWALKELNNRARLIYDSIQDPIHDSVSTGRLEALHRIYGRISKDPTIKGVMVCTMSGAVISKSAGIPVKTFCDWRPKETPTDKDALQLSGITMVESQPIHRAVFLLIDEKEDGNAAPRGYVYIYSDPTYLNQRSELTRRYVFYAFLALGFLISLVTMIVYRWSVSKPMEQMGQAMRGVLVGDTDQVVRALEKTDLAPLVKDLDEMLVEFRKAKAQAQEVESDLWTQTKLNKRLEDLFGESRVCVLAKEEPYVHHRKGNSIESSTPASGLVTTMEPIVKACAGLWIGHGSGTGDRETADKTGRILLPTENPEYALKRVWLTRDEEQGFHFGFSNEALWPLCHNVHERPIFRNEDWEQYVAVNAKFASVFCEEMQSTRPIALIQNYHFSLLPAMIKKMRPDALVSLYWHIPWPSVEAIRICPWRKEILTGMIGADFIGFQTPIHSNNFLFCVERLLEARVSREQNSITVQGHTCYVKSVPMGVEFPPFYDVPPQARPHIRKQFIQDLALPENATVGVGIDRLDYTKGILEKFRAIERLLDTKKELVGKLVFVQTIAPNRLHLRRYQDLRSEIQKEADRINWKFYSDVYQPIVLKIRHYTKEELFNYYRAADFCYIGALDDGMNLVAKEFIASRSDGEGVLVLSRFTGAAQELTDAIIVNPYDIEDTAASLYEAIQMKPAEQRERMEKMRASVSKRNVFAWGAAYLNELHNVSEKIINNQG